MKINGQRLLSDLKNLREITATPGQGVTRFSYSDEDRRAREYLARIAHEYGFTMETDPVGNITICPPGSTGCTDNDSEQRCTGNDSRNGSSAADSCKGRTIIGSHIDTVKSGGWLDGIYGVMSGMEVLRTLAENNAKSNVALMIYAEEEGSGFGSTMTGSKFLTGKYKESDLTKLVDDEGRTLKDLLEECGYWDAEAFAKVLPMNFDGIDQALELHIEQGPVMDREGLQIGIVDTVFGMHVLEIEYAGLGNHAGASPMIGRRDAMSAFGETAVAIERAILELGQGAVATIGKVSVSPGGSNVIPDSVRFTVDIRSNKNELTDEAVGIIRQLAAEIAARRSVECEIRDIADSAAIPFSRDVIEEMVTLAEEQGLVYKVMDSGAVHDTAMLAPYTRAGMIFVPSINGRSHVPEENTNEEDLVRGTQFLMDYIERSTC